MSVAPRATPAMGKKWKSLLIPSSSPAARIPIPRLRPRHTSHSPAMVIATGSGVNA